MKDTVTGETIHTQHVKWMIAYQDGTLGAYGWESADQGDYRFYELARDAAVQGDDYSFIRIVVRTGSPESFLKQIGLPERREFYREFFEKEFSALAEEPLHQTKREKKIEMSVTLKPVTELHPFQLLIEFKDDDPVVAAFWIHVIYSRKEGYRVRRCDQCHRIFLREGKKPRLDEQVYCSTSCMRTAVTTRYLANRKAKAEATKAAKAEAAKAGPTKASKPVLTKKKKTK